MRFVVVVGVVKDQQYGVCDEVSGVMKVKADQRWKTIQGKSN